MKSYYITVYDKVNQFRRCVRWNLCRAGARYYAQDSDTGREADLCGQHLTMFLQDKIDMHGKLR